MIPPWAIRRVRRFRLTPIAEERLAELIDMLEGAWTPCQVVDAAIRTADPEKVEHVLQTDLLDIADYQRRKRA